MGEILSNTTICTQDDATQPGCLYNPCSNALLGSILTMKFIIIILSVKGKWMVFLLMKLLVEILFLAF